MKEKSSTWNPGQDPNPLAVLYAGAQDVQTGCFAIALDKFIWFQNNALSIEPELCAVRRTYAIGHLVRLASVYPPALIALKKMRDDAESKCRQDGFSPERFGDFVVINQRLGDNSRTLTFFRELMRCNLDAAYDVYYEVEECLIEAKEYATCNRFLEPQKRLQSAEIQYRLNLGAEETSQIQHRAMIKSMNVPRQIFAYDVGRLIALLTLNNRHCEARETAAEALKVLEDADFRATLNGAMDGIPPERPGSGKRDKSN